MTSSLYFLPPTSRPPWPLISSKISSMAFLWGMPQGAAGPDSGVETPNLMTSAAPAPPGLPIISTATAKSVTGIRGNDRFIACPSCGPAAARTVTGTISEAGDLDRLAGGRALGHGVGELHVADAVLEVGVGDLLLAADGVDELLLDAPAD